MAAVDPDGYQGDTPLNGTKEDYVGSVPSEFDIPSMEVRR